VLDFGSGWNFGRWPNMAPAVSCSGLKRPAIFRIFTGKVMRIENHLENHPV